MERQYSVSFEIAGPAAIFTRPDSGATFVSYPAPTYSAVRGMFECVARLKSAYIRPTHVELCAPIQYRKYVTNYRGPLRKGDQLRKGSSYQLVATVLVDVCYRCYGDVEAVTASPGQHNHLHYLQARFQERLKKGRLFYTPCLGWKEFVPSYFGPLRPDTRVEESIDELSVPSMLHSVFDSPISGKVAPTYRHGVVIRKGVLIYAE